MPRRGHCALRRARPRGCRRGTRRGARGQPPRRRAGLSGAVRGEGHGPAAAARAGAELSRSRGAARAVRSADRDAGGARRPAHRRGAPLPQPHLRQARARPRDAGNARERRCDQTQAPARLPRHVVQAGRRLHRRLRTVRIRGDARSPRARVPRSARQGAGARAVPRGRARRGQRRAHSDGARAGARVPRPQRRAPHRPPTSTSCR